MFMYLIMAKSNLLAELRIALILNSIYQLQDRVSIKARETLLSIFLTD